MRDVYKAALGLGTANQLTNILRDVGEDATERNRIYVPTDELKQFGITESDVSFLCDCCTAALDHKRHYKHHKRWLHLTSDLGEFDNFALCDMSSHSSNLPELIQD